MMIHSSQELAVCLKDRRQQLRLSQTEVVDRVGLLQKTLSAFENKPDSTKLSDTGSLRFTTTSDSQRRSPNHCPRLE
jgi:DNA-binding XRE family transcriptional regulator